MRYAIDEICRIPEGQTFDFCVPTISVNTEYVPCKDSAGNDNHILLMYVPASPRLHSNQADEVFWRVGDKSRRLSFEERLQLMYDKGERYYEDSPVYGASVDDIDMDAVQNYILKIGYGKSSMEYLNENHGFLTGKPDTGRVSAACAYLETQVKEYSYLGEDGLFLTEREYPKFVIQEMVVNSVCHRDYSIKGTEIQIKMFDDRIVFETPGKLPGIVRIDNMRHTHFSRNPKIAEYLKAYDYVKEFGEGVDRMCRELSLIGGLEPQYKQVAFIMKASVYALDLNGGHEKGMNGAQTGRENILALIRANPKISIMALAEACGLSVKVTRNMLEELKKNNAVVRHGPAKGGYWEVIID